MALSSRQGEACSIEVTASIAALALSIVVFSAKRRPRWLAVTSLPRRAHSLWRSLADSVPALAVPVRSRAEPSLLIVSA